MVLVHLLFLVIGGRKMSELNIDKEMYMWFLKKVKSLEPGNKEIRIGTYVITFKYVLVRTWLGDVYDEVLFRAIHPKAKPNELANIVMLEFWVDGLYKDYVSTMRLYKNEDDTFKMEIYPDRTKETIDEFINIINNEINKTKIREYNDLVNKLTDIYNYLNDGYKEAFDKGLDEYIVYTDEMFEKAIKPLGDVKTYLIGGKNE